MCRFFVDKMTDVIKSEIIVKRSAGWILVNFTPCRNFNKFDLFRAKQSLTKFYNRGL